ncbi:MAG: MotA/TolQ/ExbB proton channel family protein [Bacteroidales bacterium]|nr:MotA/TolQ/ExbB proton channel family protein [Bacteroidales bacterium]
MHYITDILYWISTGLLVPVVILLIYFFVRALLLVGGFFGQFLDLRKNQNRIRPVIDSLTADNLSALADALPKKSRSLSMNCMKKILEAQDDMTRVEKFLADFELEADKDMELPKTLAKLGPMLGLMGTLIPMGPALVGLANGDIASMAYNMQVAFATTVVGLFSSAVGFVTRQTKQRWYARDLNDLEFVANRIKEKYAKP